MDKKSLIQLAIILLFGAYYYKVDDKMGPKNLCIALVVSLLVVEVLYCYKKLENFAQKCNPEFFMNRKKRSNKRHRRNNNYKEHMEVDDAATQKINEAAAQQIRDLQLQRSENIPQQLSSGPPPPPIDTQSMSFDTTAPGNMVDFSSSVGDNNQMDFTDQGEMITTTFQNEMPNTEMPNIQQPSSQVIDPEIAAKIVRDQKNQEAVQELMNKLANSEDTYLSSQTDNGTNSVANFGNQGTGAWSKDIAKQRDLRNNTEKLMDQLIAKENKEIMDSGWSHGHSYVHPKALKMPNRRIGTCLPPAGGNCHVSPIIMGEAGVHYLSNQKMMGDSFSQSLRDLDAKTLNHILKKPPVQYDESTFRGYS